MSTHALGTGTVNLCVNVPVAMHRSVGRFAFLVDLSAGEVVRRVLARLSAIWAAARGLEQAANADAKAIAVLRAAAADGIGPEDAQAVAQAIAYIEESEREDREWASAMRVS